MRFRLPLLLAAAVVLVALTLSAASAVTYTSPDGSVTIDASTMENYVTKLVFSDKVHVHAVDKAAGTDLEADASKIVVVFYSAPGAKQSKTGVQLIKTADLSGPVKLVYTKVQPDGVKTKTTATADSASYSGSDQLARLTGNVRITNENPALFEAPAVMTGDKATINLKPNLGPDEFRFRIESSPGVSRIQVTPKSGASKQ